MLTFRCAEKDDLDLVFGWANDELVRQNSYHPHKISYSDHCYWFNKNVESDKISFYIFMDNQGSPVGQVRIEKGVENRAKISIAVDKHFRGRGYSVEMLQKASTDFINKNKEFIIVAYIFKTNEASYRSFLKSGFKYESEALIEGVISYILSYSQIQQ